MLTAAQGVVEQYWKDFLRASKSRRLTQLTVTANDVSHKFGRGVWRERSPDDDVTVFILKWFGALGEAAAPRDGSDASDASAA
jgi:hypothetical protein